ncbi:MAG: phage portal protein [Reyranella sp.]|uniref:phage portal protein n=1 Tax=Reyranella sp. TaxID=1929291 RepID=UPI001220691C|nr:phage portal protein [Reyranella sp.]TAJ91250.1 MAG: phage portal protein [Reyranella sp.]
MAFWNRKRKPEQREEWGSLDPRLAEAFGVIRSTSGATVTPMTAENLSTLFACVQAITAGIASLPALVYRKTEDGREEAPDHPLSRLIRDGVNDRESWPDFLESLLANALLRGNGLAEVVADDRGRLRELHGVPWAWVSPRLLNSGRLVFDWTDTYGTRGAPGVMRRLLNSEVVHVKDRSDDGVLGRSRLSRARETIGTALAVQTFAGSTYANQATPKGVLSFKSKLNSDQLARVKEMWKQLFVGPDQAAKTLILDQEGTFNPISVSPEDAELLASRRFTTEELARLFNVPPPIVGIWDHSSFTNSETAGRWFAIFTLTPWIRKVETEFARAVLGSGYSLEIDLSGLTRGDYAARWNAHKIAVDARILTPNEVRETEGYNARPDGDTFAEKPAAPTPTEAAVG